MTPTDTFHLVPIGTVQSGLRTRAEAPRQADEGAPPARLAIDPAYADALAGIGVGDQIVVVTWLHRADRTALTTHPRDDPAREKVGVFATRSPGRPNPIGLHETTVTALDECSVAVDGLEAVDGTPILDLKPTLGPRDTR